MLCFKDIDNFYINRTNNGNSTQHNCYDELGYYSKPFSYTSIALLEGNATFWGLKPPALKGAKVLELGSSFGGNLISQAVYYPDTEFVDVDLADSQITQGNEIIHSMGLTNVRLETKNILDITPDLACLTILSCMVFILGCLIM